MKRQWADHAVARTFVCSCTHITHIYIHTYTHTVSLEWALRECLEGCTGKAWLAKGVVEDLEHPCMDWYADRWVMDTDTLLNDNLLADICICTLCVCVSVCSTGWIWECSTVSYANCSDQVPRSHQKKNVSAEMQEKWWNMFWMTARVAVRRRISPRALWRNTKAKLKSRLCLSCGLSQVSMDWYVDRWIVEPLNSLAGTYIFSRYCW